MSVTAIIAEYNPFHNGHLYQLNKINNSYKIVIMSSNFTQRGTPAILDKFLRANLAIENGADIVLELPVIYATSNANIFSEGAISILNSLGIVDNLYFGSEDSLNSLKSIVNKLQNLDKNKISNFMSQGFSFIKSREMALDFLTEEEIKIISKPNNILGIEYLKALQKFNSDINAYSISRKNVEHSSTEAVNGYASASLIRDLYSQDNILNLKTLVPNNTYASLEKTSPFPFNNLLKLFKYKIMSDDISYSDYMDYEDGLENRFFSFIDVKDYDEFISSVSTKRYTKARVRRLIIQILFDLKRDFILESLNHPYIRVLSANKNGTTLLKKLKENGVSYITKFAKSSDDIYVKQILEKELLSTNVYNMLNDTNLNTDYKHNIFSNKKL